MTPSKFKKHMKALRRSTYPDEQALYATWKEIQKVDRLCADCLRIVKTRRYIDAEVQGEALWQRLKDLPDVLESHLVPWHHVRDSYYHRRFRAWQEAHRCFVTSNQTSYANMVWWHRKQKLLLIDSLIDVWEACKRRRREEESERRWEERRHAAELPSAVQTPCSLNVWGSP